MNHMKHEILGHSVSKPLTYLLGVTCNSEIHNSFHFISNMSGLFISLRAISTDSAIFAIFGANLWSMVPAPSLSELASAESVNFHLIGVLREGTALATNQQNATATQHAATDKCQVTGVQMDRQLILVILKHIHLPSGYD